MPKFNHPFSSLALRILFAPLLVTLAIPVIGLAQRPSRPAGGGTSSRLTAPQIAKRTLPSLVLIFQECGTGGKFGSGVVIGPRTVLTAKHVMVNACVAQFRVRLQNGTDTLKVVRVFTHPNCDLALIETDQPLSLPSVSISDRQPQLGENVYALGNPDGLVGSFSAGYVGGLRDSGATVQHTAVIAGGSSGGPLLNEFGQLIGINTGTLRANEGIAFATSAPVIRELQRLIRAGEVTAQLPEPPRQTVWPTPPPIPPRQAFISKLRQRSDVVAPKEKETVPGFSRAKVISCSRPKFPETVRQKEFSGKVILHVLVNEDGTPGETEIESGLPDGLTEEAIRTVKTARFEPARKDGVPVKTVVRMEVYFSRY